MHSQTLGFSAGQKGKNWAQKIQSQITFWNIVQSAFFSFLILKFADDAEAFILIYPTASLHFSYHNHPIMDHIAMLNNGLLPNPMAQSICLRICRSMQFSPFSMLTCIHILSSAPIPVRSSYSLNNSQSVVSDWKMKFQPIDSFFFVLQCNFKKENSPRRTERMEALLLLLILGSVSLRKEKGEWEAFFC